MFSKNSVTDRIYITIKFNTSIKNLKIPTYNAQYTIAIKHKHADKQLIQMLNK